MDKCSKKDCVDFDVSKEDSELTGDCDICSRNRQNPYMDAASDQYFQMKAKIVNPTDDVPPNPIKELDTAIIKPAVEAMQKFNVAYPNTDWRVVVDFPEYEASSLGQLRRIKTGHILKPFLSRWGYEMVDFSINGQRTRKTVHRVIAETFYGKQDLPVNHKDGIKTHNEFTNLEFVTTSENNQHAYDIGLRVAPNNSELTADDILDIVERVRSGEKQKDVALDYRLSPQAVCDMLHGRTWPHITGITNAAKCNTGIETKKENFDAFISLIRNQFWHGGEKYKLSDTKEFTDAICEVFPGASGVDWVLGTCMKYLGRYKNFGREKDLLKIATYMYLLWLKGEFYLTKIHDEDTKREG